MKPWVVVSVGGSILVRDEDDVDYIKGLASLLSRLTEEFRLGVVTGGGPLARKYISMAREFGESVSYLDYIGIGATRLNAMLLISALKDANVNVNPSVPMSHREAVECARGRDIIVMGGTEPGHTTDAVSAILAEHLGAVRFVNATSVDGAYTADPRKDSTARRIDRMTHGELLELVSGGIGAGVNVVIDPLAASVSARSHIPIYIVNGRDLKALENAIRGLGAGTVVE